MAVLQRVRLPWTGFPGGPGISTFYFTDTATPTGALRTFMQAAMNYCPISVTVSFPTTGDKIESTTGDIVGAWSAGPTTAVTGQVAAAPYSASSGLCVDWLTGSIVNGRRPMGRTFIVPISGDTYQSDGTIADAKRTVLETAGQALIASLGPNFVVWTRPFPGEPEKPGPPVIPAKPARPGASSAVVGCRVPDKAVVLRSRRD
jgi:hypothetical protein